MSKPKVLFVTEKWHANNPEFGLTNSYHNLFETLSESRLASNIRVLHFDEWFVRTGEKADSELITVVTEHKIDVVVYTWLTSQIGPTDSVGPFNPGLTTWLRLRRLNPNIKICAVWWDSTWPPSQQMMSYLYPYIDLNLTIDYTFDDAPEKVISMWTPQSPKLYYGDPSSDRPIDVAHAGRLDARPERRLALEALSERGIVVAHSGGQKEDRLAPDDYGKMFRTSKIMLDFTPHLHKGRVWETTLSGALLLAADTAQINRWFIPGEEYATYKMEGEEPNFDDLAEKICYYLDRPEERLRIAQNGFLRANKDYSHIAWWSTVLGKLGWVSKNQEQADAK